MNQDARLTGYKMLKDSGLDWLGAIPSHWDVKRLRFVATLNPSKSEVADWDASVEVSFLPMEAISEQGELDLNRTRPLGEVQTGYTFFRNGDVAIAKITPCFENGKGAVMRNLPSTVGFGTTELIIVRPKAGAADASYLNWLFSSTAFRNLGEAAMYGAGGQKRVPDDFVKNFATGIPPLPEQRAISSFLVRETAKIDALIAEQQRLIDLLKEKRQAVISHAVTKGLNPNAPMKDSGVVWLGEVPAHWTVKPLKRLACATTGFAFSSDDFVSEGVPVLRIGDITPEGTVDFSGSRCLPEAYLARYANYLVSDGDIAMAMTGATIGKAGWYKGDDPALLNQRVCVLRPTAGNLNRFLWHVLNSGFYKEHVALAAVGGAQPNISDYQILQCVVAAPAPPEQRAIADALYRQTNEFDLLIFEAQAAISLLQERRSALISAAVTGKIDVRGLVPEEAAAA